MLSDKRVLVTGAAQGMGREIAVEAARQGAAHVTVADINAELAAETLAEVVSRFAPAQPAGQEASQ